MDFNGSRPGNGRFARVVPRVDVRPGIPDDQVAPSLAPVLLRRDVDATSGRLVVHNLYGGEDGERKKDESRDIFFVLWSWLLLLPSIQLRVHEKTESG